MTTYKSSDLSEHSMTRYDHARCMKPDCPHYGKDMTVITHKDMRENICFGCTVKCLLCRSLLTMDNYVRSKVCRNCYTEVFFYYNFDCFRLRGSQNFDCDCCEHLGVPNRSGFLYIIEAEEIQGLSTNTILCKICVDRLDCVCNCIISSDDDTYDENTKLCISCRLILRVSEHVKKRNTN